jgi:hypothetical protein
VVDAAMIFAFTHGGVSTLSAAADVLLYRLISFVLIVGLGWLIWGATWIADRRRSESAIEHASRLSAPSSTSSP